MTSSHGLSRGLPLLLPATLSLPLLRERFAEAFSLSGASLQVLQVPASSVGLAALSAGRGPAVCRHFRGGPSPHPNKYSKEEYISFCFHPTAKAHGISRPQLKL